MIENLHIHPDTTHTHTECGHSHEVPGPFPPLEENLYILLADTAIRTTHAIEAHADDHELEQLTSVEARLGNRWATQMTTAQRARVARAFSQQRTEVPTSHPLFEHQHAHDDHDEENGHGCGKVHGPLRRRFDALEARILGKIKHRTTKAIAAAAFRLSALTVCPGDDIAAIGLQVHSAMVGHHESGHEHHDEQAILPRRIRVEIEQQDGSDDRGTAP